MVRVTCSRHDRRRVGSQPRLQSAASRHLQVKTFYDIGFLLVMASPTEPRLGSSISVRGAQRSFDPKGALKPTFAENRGVSLNLPENGF